MSAADPWRIPPDAPDWECTWAADEPFHLRYFRALTLPEKIRAVEQMEEVAAQLAAARPGPAEPVSAATPAETEPA